MNANRDRKPRTQPAFDADNIRDCAAAILKLIGPDPDAARHVHDLKTELGCFCTIFECDKPRSSLGLCDQHYRQHRRAVANESHLINYAARKKAS